MKLTCDFCGGYLTELDETCPHCGATNEQYKRQSNETPRTIEELKKWYVDHNLPPQEVTRFFIGENYTQPKAFGIYQDGDRFIVYKNKEDGSRAIRYDGSDEAYAVNELYLKLKERIAQQKSRQNKTKTTKKAFLGMFGFYVIILLVIVLIASCLEWTKPTRGYYKYDGNQYYYLDNNWYFYDNDYDDWSYTTVDEELSEHYDNYYESEDYYSEYGTSDFSDTSYYSTWESSQSSDSSWDSDSNWSSSDSWDSGGGDWE